MLAPCPEGWREVHGGGVPECDPYPEGGAEACGAGEAHFLGEPGCRPIGDACPAGDYAASLPSSGPLVYVNAVASIGGDGSLGAPFSTLREVPWSSLAAGTTVAIGKGLYPGWLRLVGGVSVIGACVGETVVTGIAGRERPMVIVAGEGELAQLNNLTVRDAPTTAVVVAAGGGLSVRGLLIEGARGIGILGDDPGTEVTLADVVIRDAEGAGASAADPGMGIHFQLGARLEANRVLVVNTRSTGVSLIGDGTTATLNDSAIRDTRPGDGAGLVGRGMNVQDGVRVDVTRLLVSGNRGVGVFAGGPGTVVAMSDSIIQRTESRAADGRGGDGLSVRTGSEFTATRVLVAGNREAGVFVSDVGTLVTLTDVVIRDTELELVGGFGGRGASVQSGARCDATRLLVTRNVGEDIFVADMDTVLSVTDVVVGHAPPGLERDWPRRLGPSWWALRRIPVARFGRRGRGCHCPR